MTYVMQRSFGDILGMESGRDLHGLTLLYLIFLVAVGISGYSLSYFCCSMLMVR